MRRSNRCWGKCPQTSPRRTEISHRSPGRRGFGGMMPRTVAEWGGVAEAASMQSDAMGGARILFLYTVTGGPKAREIIGRGRKNNPRLAPGAKGGLGEKLSDIFR